MVHCLDLHRQMVTNQGRKHKAVNEKNDFNLKAPRLPRGGCPLCLEMHSILINVTKSTVKPKCKPPACNLVLVFRLYFRIG